MSALTFKDLSTELTQTIETQSNAPSGTKSRCTLGREKVMVLVEYPLDSAQAESQAESTLTWLEQSLRQQFDTVGLPEEAADLAEGEAVTVQLFLKHVSEPKPFIARSFVWKVADGFDDLFGFETSTDSLTLSNDDNDEAIAALADAPIVLPIDPFESAPDVSEASGTSSFPSIDLLLEDEDDSVPLELDDEYLPLELEPDELESALESNLLPGSTIEVSDIEELNRDIEDALAVDVVKETPPEIEQADNIDLDDLKTDDLDLVGLETNAEIELSTDLSDDLDIVDGFSASASEDPETGSEIEDLEAEPETEDLEAETPEDLDVFLLPGDDPVITSSDLDLPIARAQGDSQSDGGFFDLEPDDVNNPSIATDSALAADFENALDRSTEEEILDPDEDLFSNLIDSPNEVFIAKPTVARTHFSAGQISPVSLSGESYSSRTGPGKGSEYSSKDGLGNAALPNVGQPNSDEPDSDSSEEHLSNELLDSSFDFFVQELSVEAEDGINDKEGTLREHIFNSSESESEDWKSDADLDFDQVLDTAVSRVVDEASLDELVLDGATSEDAEKDRIERDSVESSSAVQENVALGLENRTDENQVREEFAEDGFDAYDSDEYAEDSYTKDSYAEDSYTEDSYTEDSYTEDARDSLLTEDRLSESEQTEVEYTEIEQASSEQAEDFVDVGFVDVGAEDGLKEDFYQLERDAKEAVPHEEVALIDEREVQRQREQWQQQTKGNPWVFAGAIGFVVIGLLGFVFTRPCSFGPCPRIQTARAEGESALADLTLGADLQAVTDTKQTLKRSVRSLQPIPIWSPHYPKAKAVLPQFESQLSALDRISAAQEQAYAAAVASQNPPHSAADWEDIGQMWRGAIATLENVPTENPVRPLAERKLIEYRANLSTIKVRIDAESQAEERIVNAQSAATLATATADNANSLQEWESALEKWESAVVDLNQIPQGTLAYAEAQGLLADYRKQMELVRDRTLKERNASKGLSRAKQLANDAQRVESEDQWTVAVQTWIAAVKQVKDLIPGTAAHQEAQPLASRYEQSLAKAESNQQVSQRFQPVEPSFYAACGATAAQRCTYSVSNGNVRLNLFQGYDRAINQSITPPDQRQEVSLDAGVVTQSNQLLKEITLLSTQAQVPIELYDAKGEFLARYRPDLSGFVKDQET